MKVAMWSGPRNLSTAMMYSFAARGDCAVTDEPFYAAFLAASGLDHPMRDAVLASQPTDPATVAAALAGPVPGGRTHWYQKHMAHHMLPGFPTGWAEGCVNVHLIRHPARVLASYAAKRENPTLEDIGFPQQQSLFSRFPGPVVDSADIRRDPAGTLGRLCAEIGLPVTPAMLRWPPGGLPEDGVWAAHWYGAVHRSTGFDGAEGPLPEVPEALRPVLEAALPIYRAMAEGRLRA